MSFLTRIISSARIILLPTVSLVSIKIPIVKQNSLRLVFGRVESLDISLKELRMWQSKVLVYQCHSQALKFAPRLLG